MITEKKVKFRIEILLVLVLLVMLHLPSNQIVPRPSPGSASVSVREFFPIDGGSKEKEALFPASVFQSSLNDMGLRMWRESYSDKTITLRSDILPLPSDDEQPVLKDGEHVLKVLGKNGGDIEDVSGNITVNNPRQTHFWSFFFIGLGVFVLAGIAAFLITWLGNKRTRDRLNEIGYESKEVFRYVPLPSRIALFISIALYIFLFFVLITFADKFLFGVPLLICLGLSALFTYLLFFHKSLALAVAGILAAWGTGVFYLVAIYYAFVWALIGLVVLVLIGIAGILCFFLFNRYYLLMFQNREESKTSVGTNYTLNAFDLYRDHEGERRRNAKLLGAATVVPRLPVFRLLLILGAIFGIRGRRPPSRGKGGKGGGRKGIKGSKGAKGGAKGPKKPKVRSPRKPKAPKAKGPKKPKIRKPKKPEWKKKIYRAYVYGKISYTHFTNKEVKIGVFDVEDWGVDKHLGRIMLDQLIRLMKKKEFGSPFASSVRIKMLGSDPAFEVKSELLKKKGFTEDETGSGGRENVFRYDIV